jgi:GntR family transcriptional regulator, transcriptional repressor for pyruvate dehydrogenase complex
MIELGTIRVTKRYEALASLLQEQILNGEIASGDFLPNERELAERTGLSRGSVREALRDLEAKGLVSTMLGRNNGRRAIKPSSVLVSNSLNLLIKGQQVPLPVIMETIETLEPSLAGLAAQHRTDGDLLKLQVHLEALRAATGAESFLAANERWHRAIAHASNNLILIAIYDAVSPGLLDPHVSGFVSTKVRESVIYAASRIEDAIVAGDVELARGRMHRHVQAYRQMVEALAIEAARLEAPTQPPISV